MIRVNLLRKEGQHGLPNQQVGPSVFISGREVLLAATFLILGGLILWFVLADNSDSMPPVIAENQPAAAVSSAPPSSGLEPLPAVDSSGADSPGQDASPVVPTAVLPASGAHEPTISTSANAANTARSAQVPSEAATESDVVGASGTRPYQTASLQPPSEAPRPSSILSSRSAAAVPTSKPAPTRQTPVQQEASPMGGDFSGVNTLRELRIDSAGGNLQILAITDHAPEYKIFRVDHPDRVVIDIPGIRLDVPRESREQKLSHALVQGVRIAQNQIEPPVVRLVLEVSSFPELRVLSRADGLQINVSGKP